MSALNDATCACSRFSVTSKSHQKLSHHYQNIHTSLRSNCSTTCHWKTWARAIRTFIKIYQAGEKKADILQTSIRVPQMKKQFDHITKLYKYKNTANLQGFVTAPWGINKLLPKCAINEPFEDIVMISQLKMCR